MPASCYAMDINAFFFRIKLMKKKNPSENHRLPYYDGFGAGPQLPSSLMVFDYQYLNKLPIYHVEAPATEKKNKPKTVKLKMKNDDGQSVRLCLVGVERVRFFFIGTFFPSYFSRKAAITHSLPFTGFVRRFSIWLPQFEWLMTKIFLWGLCLRLLLAMVSGRHRNHQNREYCRMAISSVSSHRINYAFRSMNFL